MHASEAIVAVDELLWKRIRVALLVERITEQLDVVGLNLELL